MSIAIHIKNSFQLPEFMVNEYVGDLTVEEMYIRPIEGTNHFTWQLGHLIVSENFHINQICPREMPEFSKGFGNLFTKETASIDDPKFFPSKDDLLSEMERQRSGTLKCLDGKSDAELLSESPESIKYFGPTVGAVFSGEVTHWMMHLGQLVIIRKFLNKKTY